jgi:crotonobetainyl-CoA:carnitine CoA-transferase CaiB-like acyl-CoA transferase
MELLQGAGVPAGAMQRIGDLLDDPHLAAEVSSRSCASRGSTWTCRRSHDLRAPCVWPTRPCVPRPSQASTAREVCRDWLGMDDTEINAQEASGALEVAWGLPVEPRSAARDQRVLSQAHAQVARLGDD